MADAITLGILKAVFYLCAGYCVVTLLGFVILRIFKSFCISDEDVYLIERGMLKKPKSIPVDKFRRFMGL